jgi:hypothetical protein
VNPVELRADFPQQVAGVLAGLGQLAEMVLEVFESLAAAREGSLRRADDVNLVLEIRQNAELLLVGATQLEGPADQWRDEHLVILGRVG